MAGLFGFGMGGYFRITDLQNGSDWNRSSDPIFHGKGNFR